MALISSWLTAWAMSVVFQLKSTGQELLRDSLSQRPPLLLEGSGQFPFTLDEVLEFEDTVLDCQRRQYDRQFLEVGLGNQRHMRTPRKRSQRLLKIRLIDEPRQKPRSNFLGIGTE